MKSLQYINSIIASKKDIGLLVFRILIGIAFIWHGVPKLLSGPEGWTALGSMMGALGIHIFPTFFGLLSGLAETFGGLFILLGLFYRPMALFLVGNLMMATSIELASGAPLLQVSRPFEEGVFYPFVDHQIHIALTIALLGVVETIIRYTIFILHDWKRTE